MNDKGTLVLTRKEGESILIGDDIRIRQREKEPPK